jgi:hypothetical protein
MQRERTLQRRLKTLVVLFIAGLVLSGATAIPLESEIDVIARLSGAQQSAESRVREAQAWTVWLAKVQSAIHDVSAAHPFLFYGTDWLAFGHFAIAIAFFGAWRDPVRNRWLFDFGLIACALVIPYALVFGAVRGIPIWWRLIDCSFGVVGSIPLWFCRRWSRELETIRRVSRATAGAASSNQTANLS